MAITPEVFKGGPEAEKLVFYNGKTIEHARTAEWMIFPALVVAKNHLYLPGTSAEETPPAVINEAEAMVNQLASDHKKAGCKVFLQGQEIPQEEQEKAQVVGITFVGKLPDVAVAIIEDPFLDNDQVLLADQDLIPQAERFHDIAVVRQGRRVGLKDEYKDPGRFRSIAMIEDPTGIIRELSMRGYEGDFNSDHRLEGLIRQIFARHGSLSTVIRTWRGLESGEIEFDDPIFCTLEGGHPSVPSMEELSVRWMEVGSSKPLEIEKAIHPKRKEKIEERTENPHVGYLQNFMWYLGAQHEAFASSMKVETTVATYNKSFAENLIEFIGWAGQGEGAGGVRIPRTKDSFWSASGRFEAVKTDLLLEDIIRTVPWPEDWSNSQKEEMTLRVIQLLVSENLIERGVFNNKKFPSVESGPITHATELLDKDVTKAITEGKIPPLTHTYVPGFGYVPDKNGDTELPPITGWIHLHRGFEINSLEINHVPTDLMRFPGVSCGTDKERRMFYDASYRAWQGWELSGRQAIASLFYMPNHGLLAMPHPTANQDGFVPHNPFELSRQALHQGKIVLLDGVPQDNSKKAIENYLLPHVA